MNKITAILAAFLLTASAYAGGDYIILWQQIGHATDDPAWWVAQMETFAGPRTTDVPEQVYTNDVVFPPVVITNAAHTVTNWTASWVGGTTTNDTRYVKGGQNFKVTCISNYLAKEVQPNGDIISSQSIANTVNPNSKVTNAQIQGLLTAHNPFRGGIAVENQDAVQALKDAGFTIIEPAVTP